MNYQVRFTYIPCQTCTAKIHCDQCADEAAQSLLKIAGITAAAVDMKNKVASVECSMDCDDLEGCMEDAGLFPD